MRKEMGWDKKEWHGGGSQCPTFSILRDVREEGELQICQKSRRIGCMIPHCNLQHGITQPFLRFFDIYVHFTDWNNHLLAWRATRSRVALWRDGVRQIPFFISPSLTHSG